MRPDARDIDAVRDAVDQILEELKLPPSSGAPSGIRCACIAEEHGGDGSARNLSIWEDDEGRLGAKCHSWGCSEARIWRTIREAIGKKMPHDDHAGAGGGPRSRRHPRPPFLNDREVRAIIANHDALLDRPELVERLAACRRITRETVKAEWLGWRDGRVQIPAHSPFSGERRRPYLNEGWLPSWAREGREDEPKTLAAPGQPRWLLVPGLDLLSEQWCFLCEGWIDSLTIVSCGQPAIGAPSASTWNPSWTLMLAKLGLRKLFIPFDQDDAGRKFPALVRRGVSSSGITVVPVDLGLAEGEDVTDWLLRFDP